MFSTNKKLFSILLAVLGAICYSTVILFSRFTSGMNPMGIAFFRTFFAMLLFFPLFVRNRAPSDAPNNKKLNGWLIILGILVGVTAALYIYAVQNTTAANAVLLVNLSPIYIALLAPIVLKEKRPKFTLISLGFVAAGILLITDITNLDLSSHTMDGILAGLLSGITYSLTFLISRFLKGQVSGVTQTFWGTAIAALLLLPFAVGVPHRMIFLNLKYLMPLGFISLGLASYLYYEALQYLEAQVLSMIALLEPVSGIIMGMVVFQEFPGLWGSAGIIFILIGILIISLQAK